MDVIIPTNLVCALSGPTIPTTNNKLTDSLPSWLSPSQKVRQELLLVQLISIPYSRKYWWELNLAVEPKIAIARILADLNLVVRYGIAICIIICE